MPARPGVDRKALPPGPKGAPLQSFLYMRDPHGYYARMRRRYGDLVTMPTMNGLLVVAHTPDLAREILLGGEKEFGTGFAADVLTPIIGANSLLLLRGAAHRSARKTLSPVFHGSRMRAYGPAMQTATLDRISAWTPGDRIVIQNEMQAISLDVIIRAVLGIADRSRIETFRRVIQVAVEEISPLPLFFKFLQHEFGGFGPWAKYVKHLRRFDELLAAEIAAARTLDQPREDILARLAHTVDEEGRALSDEAIRDHLLTLLIAGHETSSTALAWAFYELARHPEIRHALLESIAELGPDPDADALGRLAPLEAFVRECLRFHPIVPEFFRTVRHSYPLAGYEIPEGVILAASILSIHRDPGVYPEPDRFRPERFLEKGMAPHEFAAFGGGHRHCLGAAFAVYEMAVVLGTILPRFELDLEARRPLRTVRRSVTLGPEGGVAMRVAGEHFGPAA